MDDKDLLLKKRFIELAERADRGVYFTFTDFLGLGEQTVFSATLSEIKGVHYESFGGTEGAERVIIRFGDPDEIGYDAPYPISVLRISAKNDKFSEKLSHRDYLGAILNLGIERTSVGDIIIRDRTAFLFIKDELCEYVKDSLVRVRNTDVYVDKAEGAPEGCAYRTELRRIQAASERLDGVISRVFNMSRDDSLALVNRGAVFIGGRECDSPSHRLRVGDVVSVRGHGRFIYCGIDGTTKKGRFNITVEVYY